MKTDHKLSMTHRWIPLVLCLLFLGMGTSAAGVDHEFIGAKKCSICHKTDKVGAQYAIWLDSKHAKAFEALGTPEAKAAAAERGIDDPQTSGACLKCHATAYYFTEKQVSSKIAVKEGVSCESCHGPGKDYMKKSVMEDREAAKEKGLVIPNEQTCRKCHNQESPTFKSFNYQEYWKKIKHPIPS